MSTETVIFIFVAGVMILVVNAWFWQYSINTFRGRDRDGVGFLPCLFLGLIPGLGQIAAPLALFCFIIRLVQSD